jgi:hypothetical protein
MFLPLNVPGAEKFKKARGIILTTTPHVFLGMV